MLQPGRNGLGWWTFMAVTAIIMMMNGCIATSKARMPSLQDIHSGPLLDFDFVSSTPMDIIPSPSRQVPLYKRDDRRRWDSSSSQHGQRPRRTDGGQNTDGTDHWANWDHSVRLHVQTKNLTFHLHLEPNRQLFHADLSIQVDGHERKDLIRDAQRRAYHGRVFLDHDSLRLYKRHNLRQMSNVINQGKSDFPQHLEIGWARILFHGDVNPERPVFEGTFTVHSEMYSIRKIDKYHLVRRSYDVQVPPSHQRPNQHRDASMIIYKESDRSALDAHHEHGEHLGTHPPHGHLSKRHLWQQHATGDERSVKGHSNETVTVRTSCGADELAGNTNGAQNFYKTLRKRYMDHMATTTGLHKRAPDGCPATKKIVYMGVAADCTYTVHYGGPREAIAQLVNDWNQATMIFESTFNVALGIVRFQIMSSCATKDNDLAWNRECSQDYTIAQRLNDFSQWRGNKNKDEAGLWHLLTKCSSGPTVGIAWLNTLCKQNITQVPHNGVTELRTGAGVSSVNINEWMVVAHEIGHNFGASHDCIASTCPCEGPGCSTCCACQETCDCQGKFLMNPTSNIKNPQFSPCTINQVCSKMPVLGSCLLNIGEKSTMGENQCGNGVQDPGEECDCGDPDGPDCVNSACCEARTCKLKAGAQCSDSNSLCCQNCKIKSAGLVCRSKKSSCDVEEMCDGQSAECPMDKTIPNGQSCEGGRCASGYCTSRDLQCQQSATSIQSKTSCKAYGNQCSLFCDSALDGKCTQFSGFYLDGTECGPNAMCNKGVCQQDTPALSTFQIAMISLGSVVAVVLLAVGSFMFSKRSRIQGTTSGKNVSSAQFSPPHAHDSVLHSKHQSDLTISSADHMPSSLVPPVPEMNLDGRTARRSLAADTRRSVVVDRVEGGAKDAFLEAVPSSSTATQAISIEDQTLFSLAVRSASARKSIHSMAATSFTTATSAMTKSITTTRKMPEDPPLVRIQQHRRTLHVTTTRDASNAARAPLQRRTMLPARISPRELLSMELPSPCSSLMERTVLDGSWPIPILPAPLLPPTLVPQVSAEDRSYERQEVVHAEMEPRDVPQLPSTPTDVMIMHWMDFASLPSPIVNVPPNLSSHSLKASDAFSLIEIHQQDVADEVVVVDGDIDIVSDDRSDSEDGEISKGMDTSSESDVLSIVDEEEDSESGRKPGIAGPADSHRYLDRCPLPSRSPQ